MNHSTFITAETLLKLRTRLVKTKDELTSVGYIEIYSDNEPAERHQGHIVDDLTELKAITDMLHDGIDAKILDLDKDFAELQDNPNE